MCGDRPGKNHNAGVSCADAVRMTAFKLWMISRVQRCLGGHDLFQGSEEGLKNYVFCFFDVDVSLMRQPNRCFPHSQGRAFDG